jgi:hypothetical protein
VAHTSTSLSTAASNQLPLYTANPDDFKGAEAFVEVVGIKARPNRLQMDRVTERATVLNGRTCEWRLPRAY